MFTGLIEDIGTVRRVVQGAGNHRVTVSCHLDTRELTLGESIAVNGACFTVVDFDDASFTFEASPESLSRTTLGHARQGSRVHLERAMIAGGRLGGHIVQGHVDGVGTVERAWTEGNSTWISILAPPEVSRYLVPKGSVTIDGVSLTVNRVAGSSFEVAIIPHTAHATLLTELRSGQPVNLEADIIGKYVHSLLSGYVGGSPRAAEGRGVTLDLLRQHGFLSATTKE
ncbi:MAG: riboflavin synthase [Myxococcales bacterium]|nr:riboflavin synthase [Myxococcales bacterium]